MSKYQNNLFLRALRREKTERTPVWMMRQAGRYLPEYRAIRKNYDFLTTCKTPELASEITIQPIDIVGVDAAIIFSDILVIPEAMGMALSIEEGRGPRLENPLKSQADADKLFIPDPNVELKYVMDALALTKKNLAGRVPLIGFAGAPWTLFAYMTEGQGTKEFKNAKIMLFKEPKISHQVLEKIAKSVATYLIAQTQAGADAVQIFDSWAGMLSYDDFNEFSLPYIRMIVQEVKAATDVPVIVFARGSYESIEDIVQTGCDAVQVDWNTDIAHARQIINGRTAIQGNLDPITLLSTPETIVARTKKIIEKMRGYDGHIFNLGHGILPDVPVEHAKLFVDTVKEFSKK